MATKARIRRQAPPLRSSTYDQRNEEERRGAGIRKGSPSSEVRGSGVRILSVDRGRDGTSGSGIGGQNGVYMANHSSAGCHSMG